MDARRIAVVVSPGARSSRGEALVKCLARQGARVVVVEATSEALQGLGGEVDLALLAVDSDAESMAVQLVLDEAQVRHTGSGVLAATVAADRALARTRLRQHNLPTPPGFVTEADPSAAHHDLGFPCIVKPAHARGRALLVATAEELAEVMARFTAAEERRPDVLVERYVRGQRVAVGLMGDEVVGVHHHGTRLSPTRLRNLSAMAQLAGRALQSRGPLQVDFVCPEVGNEVLVDVRTAVDLTGEFLEVCRAGGSSLESMCQRLVAIGLAPQVSDDSILSGTA